jgi:hypothetical protein
MFVMGKQEFVLLEPQVPNRSADDVSKSHRLFIGLFVFFSSKSCSSIILSK